MAKKKARGVCKGKSLNKPFRPPSAGKKSAVCGRDGARIKIEDVLTTDVCFICVPTPSTEDGSCDVSVVEEVVQQLHDNNYKGIIAIKSTVKPGTTQRLIEKYTDLKEDYDQ